MTYGSKVDLELAVAAYVPSWWRMDPGVVAELGARPGLEAQLEALPFVSTASVYDDGGSWTPGRTAVHDLIVATMVATGPVPTEPIVFFTIGPMGAGKTTILRQIVEAERTRLGRPADSLSRVAADDVRELFAEFADGRGSLVVQDEAFRVTYDTVLPAAREARHDIVYDTIGRVDGTNVSFGSQLRDLKSAGFGTHVLVAECPLDVCRARAETRALTNGRLVDPAVQDDTHDQPARALELLRSEPDLLDGWAVFDTFRAGDCVPITEGSDHWQTVADDLRRILSTTH